MTPSDPCRQVLVQSVDDTPLGVKRTLRVLYLFAGMKRRADVKHYLVPICRRNNINLRMIELDVLRSRKHDLSQVQRRSYYISCAKRGGQIVMVRSLSAFSTALGVSHGSPELRDRGLTWQMPSWTSP